MSDHNQYCNTKFNKLENNGTTTIDNYNFKESDELLIDAVRAYPHIYNHQDRNFKDNLMKENSWREISLAVNLPVSDCQNRWLRLRERFGREKRQRELDSRSGSGVCRRVVFPYYENMLFLNDHIKKRKSYTNVSSVKRSKNEEVMENTACTQLASVTASMTLQRDIHDSNLSINNDITANRKFAAPNSTSKISNSKDELIRPYTNFVTCKKNVLQRTGPALSAIALDNDSVTISDSSRRCTADIPRSLDESDETSTSSISFKESTPSPGSSVTQATLLSRRLSNKKIKNNSFHLENSLLSLCETINQNLQGNRNPEVAGNWNEAFAKLVVHLLDRLPLNEQLKRQQSMLEILYETYNK